jgi:hypothetical protein
MDLSERLQAALGMSRVFVATETSLGRQVVIKVLPPELAAGLRVGEPDSAVARLEQLLALPAYTTIPGLRIDPVWAGLHGNPRFEKLVRTPAR